MLAQKVPLQGKKLVIAAIIVCLLEHALGKHCLNTVQQCMQQL
jgi:hypothetical protein